MPMNRLYSLIFIALISGGCAAPMPRDSAITDAWPADVRIEFSDNPARRGDPVHVRVLGLTPGAEVRVRAERLSLWQPTSLYRTEARFVADSSGQIDLATDVPIAGRWASADPNALFWTMRTVEEDLPEGLTAEEVSVEVFGLGDELITRAVLTYASALVELIESPLGAEFPGAFLLRRPGSEPRPVIVVLGGSEGNDGAARNEAPLWAERGYAAVGLPYYSPAWGNQPQAIPGLPRGFANIPLDTLIGVRDALRLRSDVDSDRIGLLGISKGAEFVLAGASRIDGFAAVAAIVPSDVIWEGWGAGSSPGRTPSFSWRGEPLDFVPYVGIERAIGQVPQDERVAMRVPHAEGRARHPGRAAAARIRVEDIDEPVFVLGGGQDQVWDSGEMAARIAAVRADAGLETDVLIFAEAGHGISGPPQTPTRHSSINARSVGWVALQAFFERTLKGEIQD